MSLSINKKLLVIKEYKEYENKGLVPKLSCPNDKDFSHMSLIPATSSDPDDDNVYLDCFTCGYHITVGHITLDYLKAMILDSKKAM